MLDWAAAFLHCSDEHWRLRVIVLGALLLLLAESAVHVDLTVRPIIDNSYVREIAYGKLGVALLPPWCNFAVEEHMPKLVQLLDVV